jgi:glycosyltransferase involved in cell wall biosynthesis
MDSNMQSPAMKVLFIGNYDIPVHNIRPEAEMILGLKARGVAVEVMTHADCFYARHMASSGIRIHDYVPPGKYSVEAVRAIRRVLKESRPDIIHLFNNNAIVNAIFASLGLPVKVVTYRGQTGNISRYDPICYLTHLSPRVDKVVCVAEAVKASLEREVRDPSKLVTIYKGHDIRWYENIEPAPWPENFQIPDNAFVVGCVANNRPRKGVPVLIESSDYLPDDANIHFVLLGGGMESSLIKQKVQATRHPDRFHFLGYTDDVLPVVAACDATVLPAIKREGLPKTVIESMALAVPPVVTSTGGSPELVVSGESGLVVAPGDPRAIAGAILELSTDRNRSLEMGRKARQRIADCFRLEDSVEKHYRLYCELLGVSASRET